MRKIKFLFRHSSQILAIWLASTVGIAAEDLSEILEKVRDEYGLPAVAAAVLSGGHVIALDAVGVRKIGNDAQVTADDQFHLGSCTKAMTATMIARLVDQGRLAWDSNLVEIFPEMKICPAYAHVTLKHLLSHRAGLRKASWPEGKTFREMHHLPGSPRQQRRIYVEMVLNQEPAAQPGTQTIYANAGYTVAAVIAEQTMDTAWEELMRELLFEPLSMDTAGFGPMGTPGILDQPRQHRKTLLGVRAVEPGRYSDNPAVIGPGGIVHCSMADWAKFIQLHLATSPVQEQLLRSETLQVLHEPLFGGDYACGWQVLERGWGGGKVLTHNGTNNSNYAVAWLAPQKHYAVLVATNQGGSNEAAACDAVAATVIARYPPGSSTNHRGMGKSTP
ncbi:MAG: beta-lactamase family protein [Pirellulales bacterium]|nr:beta-lactamase family protein [Pirellulales bacterium]